MLDTWYNVELCSSDINGKEKFLNILEDESIAPSALAHTMKSRQNQANDLIVEIHQVEHEREDDPNGRQPQNIKCRMFQQSLVGSYPNFKLNLRGPNQSVQKS